MALTCNLISSVLKKLTDNKNIDYETETETALPRKQPNRMGLLNKSRLTLVIMDIVLSLVGVLNLAYGETYEASMITLVTLPLLDIPLLTLKRHLLKMNCGVIIVKVSLIIYLVCKVVQSGCHTCPADVTGLTVTSLLIASLSVSVLAQSVTCFTSTRSQEESNEGTGN